MNLITVFSPAAIPTILSFWLLIAVVLVLATRPHLPTRARGLALAGVTVRRAACDALATLAKLLLALVAAFGLWWLAMVSGSFLQVAVAAKAAREGPPPVAQPKREYKA
jgi:hypothetical protein